MKKIVSFILFAVISTLITNISYSQDSINRKLIISWEPQYMINNGVKINFDFKIDNKNWIEVSPHFYITDKENTEKLYNSLIGGGLDLSHRILLNKENKSPYFAYGITAQYFRMTYSDDVWITYTQNDLEYISYEEMEVHHNIVKIGPHVIIGYQGVIDNRVIIDIYTGLGIRKSINFCNKNVVNLENRFNRFYGDFGYTGTMILLGFRIGFLL